MMKHVKAHLCSPDFAQSISVDEVDLRLRSSHMCFLVLVYDKLQLAVLTRARVIPKEATFEPVLTVACSLEYWACGSGV